MAEYIERENAHKMFLRYFHELEGNPAQTLVCDMMQAMYELPTADVVPKSDSLPLDVCEALKQRAVEKAKADVAREIFEEIWSSIAIHAFTAKSEDYEDGAYDTIEWVDSKIAEVEKKYTEGE